MKSKRKTFIAAQTPNSDGFTCKVCGWKVSPPIYGERHRNHCPNCLSSLHLDNEPGDREADCGGIMEPIGVWVMKNGEWAVIHRCKVCGHISANHVAPDDNAVKLISIAMKPVACPPFPIEHMTELAERINASWCKAKQAEY